MAYEELKKNNVSAKDQLGGRALISYINPEGKGRRVLFVGNSITLHSPKADIGWNDNWGMAASAEEKDYVHLLEHTVLQEDPTASFCICQVAAWERQYKNGSETHEKYASAREFGADIIVIRCIENCPKDGFDETVFQKELDALIRYLDREQKAKVIISTGFWHHPGDGALRAYAKEHGYPCVELGDLGDDDAMKAIGLFEHRGVANHPGDRGMQMIAERLAEQLLPLVRR